MPALVCNYNFSMDIDRQQLLHLGAGGIIHDREGIYVTDHDLAIFSSL